MAITTWEEEISLVAGDDKIISCTLNPKELQIEFNDSYGSQEGVPLRAWSEEYVYFSVAYDGSKCVSRVPRNPCNVACEHIGDG